MRCNKFDEIMRYLHFADDTNLSTDRYCKIRPLVEDLNGAFKQADISENSSIDETMIPYMIPSAEIRNCLYASVKLPKWACSYSVKVHLQSKMPSTFFKQVAGQKEPRSVIVTVDAPGTDAPYVTLHPDNSR